MTLDILLALVALALASVWTPGPNNLMLASSGATFGFRATMPHALGVALGFPLMMFIVAMFLGEFFQRWAWLREALRWAGVALLLWIGWRIARAGRAKAQGRAKPFTFAQAAAFQWVNPKAWAMAVATAANFATGAAPMREAAICALAFVGAGLTSATGWSGFGAAIRRFLSSDARLRAFNMIMGAMIALCALYLAIAPLS